MIQSYNLKVDIPQKNAYSYDILIGCNLLDSVDELVNKYSFANKFLIVTNEKVAGLYKDKIAIDKANWLVLPDGEEYKNFETLKLILDAAVKNKLERKDCIVAFGGGVAGDMAGFAAATYMRGCDFIQIPTTLLAQVDSSVGGKVAVNHEDGKNLIGAFYQPKAVIADINVLKTLDLRQLKTGLSEILKYALIEKSCAAPLNYRLYDFLTQNKQDIFDLNPEIMSKLVHICCALKASVVNQDETEKGLRAILNLGHTYAHAIESLTNYTTYTHGEAVGVGLKMALNLALIRGLIDNDYFEKSINLIDEYQIAPKMPKLDKEEFYNVMFLDKKAKNGKIRFVVPNGMYSVAIVSDISKEQVMESISTCL